MKTRMINLALVLSLFGGISMNAQDLVMVTHIAKPAENLSLEAESKKTFKFYAFSQNDKLEKYDIQVIDEHFLGESIARKMQLFSDVYTVKTPVSPGNPTMKISIRKPLVYSSVKKIEKQLKKDIKSNTIDIETARKLYDKVLDIAINIVNDDTEDFEKEIKSSEEPSALIELFTQRVILNYI
ncbi:MAG TPA: hypothetical protein VHO72_08540 [Bacteroidales bacterium]|nr:hypothetical protein [Bacteroidales bacterium]